MNIENKFKLLIMLFHSDETVPYLTAFCDEIVELNGGSSIKLIKKNTGSYDILSNYDYYLSLIMESEEDEKTIINIFKNFKQIYDNCDG